MTTKLIPDPPPAPSLANTYETQLIQVSDLLRQANTRLCECSAILQGSSNELAGFLLDIAQRAIHQILAQRSLPSADPDTVSELNAHC